MFSVKSFYEKLLVRAEEAFPVKSIRIPEVLRKVCVFTWLVVKRVILTAENLGGEKVIYISWCYLCKGGGRKCRSPSISLQHGHKTGGICSVDLVCLG